MTDQKEHYDRFLAWQQAFRERLGINRPQLLQALDESKKFYLFCRIIYAIEDSLSFLFGNLKLVFSLMHSYKHESDSGASDDLHTFMVTPDGIIVTAVIGALLIIVQVAGAILLDSKDLNENKYKYFFAKILAPYLRDVLQGVKWAYKGMRSVLNTIFYFMLAHKGIILKILFPLSIGIAVLSLLNRVFLRWMRNLRKWMQSNNRKRSIQAYEMGCELKFRKKMPKDNDEEAWRKLKNSLLYDLSAKSDKDKIYYVDNYCTKQKIDVSDETLAAIKEKIEVFQTENVLRRVKQDILNDMNRRYHNVKYEKFEFIDLGGQKPTEIRLVPEYKNTLVYLTDKDRDKTQRLYRVDENGLLISDAYSAYYSRLIQNEIDDKAALNLLTWQVDELVKLIRDDERAKASLLACQVTADTRLGPTPTELANFVKENTPVTEEQRTWFGYKREVIVTESKIAKQPKWLMYSSYMAVFLCALIDSSYFYIGVLFITMLNPAQFISMLAMAAVMMVVCLVGRLYEEYNYQKVFRISQVEVSLNTQKTVCRKLYLDYKRLNESAEVKKLRQEIKDIEESIGDASSSGEFKSLGVVLEGKSPEEVISEKQQRIRDILEPTLEEFRNALKSYDKEQKKLEKTLHMSTSEAFLRGLRNGLSSQGVVSSIMFFGATIMLLAGVPCPPLFLISMMAISFAYMAYAITSFMLCHREYKRNHTKLDNHDFDNAEVGTDADFANLENIKKQLDENVICRPPNDYTEEYEERRRLWLSGFCKAQKNFGEFTLGAPRHGEAWWLTLISVVFSGLMAVVFIFRGDYKMFNSPDENPNIVKNDGLKGRRFTLFDPKKTKTADENNSHDASRGGSPTKMPRDRDLSDVQEEELMNEGVSVGDKPKRLPMMAPAPVFS